MLLKKAQVFPVTFDHLAPEPVLDMVCKQNILRKSFFKVLVWSRPYDLAGMPEKG